MLIANCNQSGATIGRAFTGIESALTGAAFSHASKFILEAESRGGGHVRESRAIERGKVPLGEREGAEVCEGQRFRPFSVAQREEIEEIFRGAYLEAWSRISYGGTVPGEGEARQFLPAGFPSPVSVWGHAPAFIGAIMGRASRLPLADSCARVWIAARGEASRRAQSFLRTVGDRDGRPADVVSLDWMREEHGRELESARDCDATGEGTGARAYDRAARLGDAIARAEGVTDPGGEFHSLADLGEAFERSGAVVSVPWGGQGGRGPILREACAMLTHHARARRAEVREFLGEVVPVLLGDVSMPLAWLTDPGKGDESGIIRRIREGASRNGARLGGAEIWARAVHSVAMRRYWEARDILHAVAGRPAIIAARARDTFAFRALSRRNADRGAVYEGGAVSVSVSGRRCLWLPGCVGLVPSRALSLSVSRGETLRPSRDAMREACESFAARIAARGEARGEAPAMVAAPATVAGAGRPDLDTYFFLLQSIRRTTRPGTGARAVAVSDAWAISADRESARAMRALLARDDVRRGEAFAAWLASRAGTVAKNYRYHGAAFGLPLSWGESIHCEP